MGRRLYYIFPDAEHAEELVDELLLKRISISHMHVVADNGVKLGRLPEASIFQTRDIRHSFLVGLGMGAILGVATGVIAHNVLNLPIGGIMLGATIVGALLGAWAATMIGMTTENTELAPFNKAIHEGKLLLILDLPKSRVEEVEMMVKKTHPEALFKGVEPTIPSFP